MGDASSDRVGVEADRKAAGGRGLVRGLGPVATTALVAGNIVGSGIFVIPATLAEVAGPVSLIAWLLVAAAMLLLTVVFADLAGAYPVSGGIQVHVQIAFGDLAGLVIAFVYWISQVIGNAAYVTAFVGYAAVFFPGLADPISAFALAQLVLWGLTLVNVAGVRAGGFVQIAATALKVVPLVVLGVALLASGSTANLVPFAPRGWGALFPAVSLVAWIFLGTESVTVPAEEVRGSSRTLRRAAYAGFGIATAVYLLVALGVAFGVPPSEIAGSPSPLARAARAALGGWGESFVTLGALVSLFGVLNGWLLVTGRLPFAAARQGLAPAAFGRLHRRTGTPAVALVFSSGLTALLVFLYFNRTLLQAYNFVALASSATALVAVAAAAAALAVLSRREPERFTPAQRRRGPLVGAAGALIALAIIAGSGATVVGLTVLVAALPIPVHLWLRRRRAGGRAPA